MSDGNKKTLGAVLYKGFEVLDLYGPLEMFGNLGPELEIVTVAQTKGAVKSGQGPETVATYDFDDCPALDLILLPGGWGTMQELENPVMLEFLRRRSVEAETVMSVCSGSAILAKAGLLDGRRATSNKQFFAIATAQSDRVEWVEKARWVEDGRFATSSGVSAGTDMALGVIARLYGEDKARELSELTEYERQTDAGRDPFHAFLNQGMQKLAG